MSTAVFQRSNWQESHRHEPNRLPAGLLAIAVHGAFFALLYFGFAWQVKPFEMMRVELWQTLPETVEAPVEKPKVVEIVKPVEPPKIEKPEIVLPEKKKVETRPVKEKPVKQRTAAKPASKQPTAQKQAEVDQELLVEEQQAERARSEQAAARGRLIKEYGDKIKSKITRNIVMPPNVPDSALAVFRVTLLPGGGVLSAEMQKSSGNAAYDNAVERAIYKSDPLPMPPDPAMFKDFRILKLEFQPKK